MQPLLRIHRNSIRGTGMLLAALMGAVSPAFSEEKPAAPGRTPKLREVVEIPEDYFGRTFTYNVKITTRSSWLQRGSAGDFFLFVVDSEGTQLPHGGISPGATVNLLRFVLPKEDGRKLIDRLTADKMYDARIRFTIDREREPVSRGWLYLARINSVELP